MIWGGAGTSFSFLKGGRSRASSASLDELPSLPRRPPHLREAHRTRSCGGTASVQRQKLSQQRFHRRFTYVLDELAHARLRDAASAKELDGVGRGLLGGPRAVRLEERDLPRELRCLLLVRLWEG